MDRMDNRVDSGHLLPPLLAGITIYYNMTVWNSRSWPGCCKVTISWCQTTYHPGDIAVTPTQQWSLPEIKKGYPDSKVHGANMGPIWGRQNPGGPHVGPMNLAIWVRFPQFWTTPCTNMHPHGEYTKSLQNWDYNWKSGCNNSFQQSCVWCYRNKYYLYDYIKQGKYHITSHILTAN